MMHTTSPLIRSDVICWLGLATMLLGAGCAMEAYPGLDRGIAVREDELTTVATTTAPSGSYRLRCGASDRFSGSGWGSATGNSEVPGRTCSSTDAACIAGLHAFGQRVVDGTEPNPCGNVGPDVRPQTTGGAAYSSARSSALDAAWARCQTSLAASVATISCPASCPRPTRMEGMGETTWRERAPGAAVLTVGTWPGNPTSMPDDQRVVAYCAAVVTATYSCSEAWMCSAAAPAEAGVSDGSRPDGGC